MRRRSVWRGALWLSLGSLGSRFLGATYRIALPRILGDYGLGLFQMAYPLYSVLLALSVNGIPTAMAKLTAEQVSAGRAEAAERVSSWALVWLGGVGFLLAGLLEWWAPVVARGIFLDPAAALPIRAMAPALGFVALEAGLRGFFQGQQDMAPTALSQLMEQLVRIAVMFPAAVALLPRGPAWAAAGATLGAPAGALAGVGYLLWRRSHRHRWRLGRQVPWGDLRRLAAAAAPMSLSGLLFPLMMLVDSLLVPERLRAAGWGLHAATAAYGRLSGEALPLINLTIIVGTALGVSLVPAVAEAMGADRRRDAHRRVGQAVRLVWLAGIPMGVGLGLLAVPLTRVLYAETGAAPALAVLAVGAPFLSLQPVLGFSLQAAGRGWLPVRNLLVGAAVKLALTWWLTPAWGVTGAAVGTVAAAAVTAFANARSWRALAGGEASAWWLAAGMAWPLVAALVMAMGIRLWLHWGAVAEVMRVGGGVVLGAALYGATLVAAGQASSVWALLRDR